MCDVVCCAVSVYEAPGMTADNVRSAVLLAGDGVTDEREEFVCVPDIERGGMKGNGTITSFEGNRDVSDGSEDADDCDDIGVTETTADAVIGAVVTVVVGRMGDEPTPPVPSMRVTGVVSAAATITAVVEVVA